MPWHARLQLDYALEHGRTVLRHRHEGPLRVLQSLYPEGDAVCHNVLVHPPGGLVGGDTLELAARVGRGAHALLTTAGAARFYKTLGEPACQRTRLSLAPGARLEWLPLEAIAYDACAAENRLEMVLAPGAELIGWDATAFGLPGAGLPFARGSFVQHLEVPGVWLERGRIEATDHRLMDGPLGLAGRRCMASLFFVAGEPLAPARRQAALELARSLIDAHAAGADAGATSPDARALVVRVLTPLVEPAMDLLKCIRDAWRSHFWHRPAVSPRVWAT